MGLFYSRGENVLLFYFGLDDTRTILVAGV